MRVSKQFISTFQRSGGGGGGKINPRVASPPMQPW